MKENNATLLGQLRDDHYWSETLYEQGSGDLDLQAALSSRSQRLTASRQCPTSELRCGRATPQSWSRPFGQAECSESVGCSVQYKIQEPNPMVALEAYSAQWLRRGTCRLSGQRSRPFAPDLEYFHRMVP